MKLPDIDIDTKSNFDGIKIFTNVIQASRILKGELLPHASGYYFQNIPVDPITKLSAIPFREANELGLYIVYNHIIF